MDRSCFSSLICARALRRKMGAWGSKNVQNRNVVNVVFLEQQHAVRLENLRYFTWMVSLHRHFPHNKIQQSGTYPSSCEAKKQQKSQEDTTRQSFQHLPRGANESLRNVELTPFNNHLASKLEGPGLRIRFLSP